MLLRTAIAEGVEYIDLEDDVASKIPRFGRTKRIISLPRFPQDARRPGATIHRRWCALDADIVKICTMANHPHDNLRMLQLARQSKVPTVGICMGDIGMPTRILAGRFGAAVHLRHVPPRAALAPGQLSYQQMTEIYRYDQINADDRGLRRDRRPGGTQPQPADPQAGLPALKLNKVYLPFRVPREDLSQFIDDAPALGIKGLSVTIPHKEEIVQEARRVRRRACAASAPPTPWCSHGDARVRLQHRLPGRHGSLEEALRPRAAKGRKRLCSGKTALVLGAGGAGMAIAYGLLRRGAQVVIADGVARQANLLAKRLNCRCRRLVAAAHGRAPTCCSIARRWACTPTSTKRPTTSTICALR